MSPMPVVAGDELRTVIARGGPVLVDFRADWCMQCGPQANVLERVAPAYDKVSFVSVDVGTDPGVADEYGVSGLPALLLFNGSELRTSLMGFSKAPKVRDALDRLVEIEPGPHEG